VTTFDHVLGNGGSPYARRASDEEALRRYLCIHHPHKISAVMWRALAHPNIVAVLTKVIGPNVKAMQSMLFIKAEGKPGQAWHQDEYFIPTRDRSLTAAWIALDDATIDNGCLWVLPGSHARGVIYPDREHGDERFDCAIEAYDFPYRDSDAVPVEVPAGSIVFFNGYLLHRSLPNTSARGLRRALVDHYMSAESLLPWLPPAEGEHMAKADDRDIVLVAGRDPYAWKGIEDRHQAHVRPDREGGCDR
jgi:phytanoyl-CoA hydroxylase